MANYKPDGRNDTCQSIFKLVWNSISKSHIFVNCAYILLRVFEWLSIDRKFTMTIGLKYLIFDYCSLLLKDITDSIGNHIICSNALVLSLMGLYLRSHCNRNYRGIKSCICTQRSTMYILFSLFTKSCTQRWHAMHILTITDANRETFFFIFTKWCTNWQFMHTLIFPGDLLLFLPNSVSQKGTICMYRLK